VAPCISQRAADRTPEVRLRFATSGQGGRHPSINRDHRPRDIGRSPGAEERRQFSDFFGLPAALERGAFHQLREPLCRARSSGHSVSMKPGQMAIARMPRVPYSTAAALVNAITPALAAE
jgi:hypothetical protein